ncbi:hypothetical protein NIES2104_61730 [Leptolyngbya sp. NIES-2104]|nr:hypothetical protein NIES2104_61730 [Leptolyngbya sp. NIES-2104]
MLNFPNFGKFKESEFSYFPNFGKFQIVESMCQSHYSSALYFPASYSYNRSSR